MELVNLHALLAIIIIMQLTDHNVAINVHNVTVLVQLVIILETVLAYLVIQQLIYLMVNACLNALLIISKLMLII